MTGTCDTFKMFIFSVMQSPFRLKTHLLLLAAEVKISEINTPFKYS